MNGKVTNTAWDEWMVKYGQIPFRLVALVGIISVTQAGFFVEKFTASGQIAAIFGQLGAPSSAVLVVLLGIIEAIFVITALLGFYPRVPAAIMFIEMIFAMFYQGPVVNNITMMMAAYFIAVYGTGKLSIRDPDWIEIYAWMQEVRGNEPAVSSA
jgi:uncharacterized membrane protein YphA (DoxX/SURF4 family)